LNFVGRILASGQWNADRSVITDRTKEKSLDRIIHFKNEHPFVSRSRKKTFSPEKPNRSSLNWAVEKAAKAQDTDALYLRPTGSIVGEYRRVDAASQDK